MIFYLDRCSSLKWIMATKEDSCSGKVSKLCVLWFLGFLPLTLAITSNVSGHDLEIANLLKKINKPYVKSIKSPDGDIIDCVPINLQPAFDNPLLKNHTIQMRPSSYPKASSRNLLSREKTFIQLWQTKGRCPKGTIPIRRTRKEDLLRAKSFQSYGKKSPQTNAQSHEYAVRSVDDGEYYGAKALINVWNPRVKEANEFSLSQIWVSAGEDHVDLNSVEAGWQVYYDLYGDDRTRLFGYWTRDAYKSTGCYNLACSGFVQISGAVALGATISPISSYQGKQYQISIYMFKDTKTGDWWLNFGDKPIGYWPASLFTHLRDSASSIDWGGEVVNRAVGGKHTTTMMGSGQFAEEGFGKSANFIHLEVVDESNELRTPVDLQTRVTNPGCYDLKALNTDYWGEFFYFGGPGRSPNCP